MVNFLKFRWLYFLISAIVIGSGIFSIIKWGYKYSIDFVGGTNLKYQLNKKIDDSVIKNIFVKNKVEIIEYKKTDNTFSVKTKTIEENIESKIKKDIEASLKAKVTLLRSETVGPTIGKESVKKTLIASIIAITGILVYMTFAFKSFNFALSAILAMVHDFLVVVGSYAILSHFYGAEIDTLFVTALLTTMSFSVHDTIIIFDKIREYLRTEGTGNIEFYADKALTETLVRSLNNSMTIIFMLLSLTLLGGSSIRFFIITLLIGTITGTYSSPFIATPILVWLEKRKIK